MSLSPYDILAAYIVAVTVIVVLFAALLVFLTAGDDGGVHRPRWPERYPYAEPPQHKAPGRAARLWAWAVRS